jgi:large subunit ribosomal protein L10
MSITKSKKKDIIDGLTKGLKTAKSVVFVNFHHLNVADEQAMRKALRASGVKYIVVRKTLAKIALKETNVAGEMPALDNEIAFVYGEDLTAPARETYSFQKKYKDNVAIVGGVFEGKYMSKEEMLNIASIPSIQTLYAQFVNVINSPIQGFVCALSEIAKAKPAV